MPSRTSPPFRADHVGSLLRPAGLLQARERHAAGGLTDVELRQIEDEAIRDVVRMQESVGLQSATDGEFRRASWHMDFIYQLGGVTKSDTPMHVQFFNEEGTLDFAPQRCRSTPDSSYAKRSSPRHSPSCATPSRLPRQS